MENWPQIQTKYDSRAFYAFEASFCAVPEKARIRPKLVKENDLASHEPDT